MLRTSHGVRLGVVLVPVVGCVALLSAAAPPQADTPDDLIRRANDVFRTGDAEAAEAADKLYAAAEERTADPGLVAFNRAAVYFERGLFAQAEKHYDRVLGDAACPADRAAKAWYNRGTCLLRRGGSMGVYRSAVACFENTIDSPAADDPLKADARHNLELAKLLWNEERKKAAQPEEESPNKNLPPEEDRQPRPDLDNPSGLESNPGDENPGGGTTPKPGTQPQPVPQPNGGPKPTPTDQQAPGANANLQAPKDEDEVQQLTPEDARAYMKETSKRRKRELQSLLEMLYGPDRPGVRDW
jgi:tetratricopeptide (TPR) repeat protein